MINQIIYTTRIDAANDPVDYSITLSQFVYHATKPGNRPNSVILADKVENELKRLSPYITFFNTLEDFIAKWSGL
ncbi:hypothetical protein [Petroclostridium sp. X23]|uniref:hypothetical protein n=1 Tax=Petroclostridium sp. X23 TaxID=3045146 RepID=UPI0024ADE3BB|nr:hypothetical protein [Petroclostridium sp. X23]WHH60146.1 hypothetical protein QKW49_05260 [Petroclostridium sp. X23]